MSRLVADEGKFLMLHPDNEHEKWMVILSEYQYWGRPEISRALQEWCHQYNSECVGSIVSFPDEQTATMFKLRWS